MGTVRSSQFKPAWWLRSPHLQTLWPTFTRSRPKLDLTPERVELEDGDFLDLAWTQPNGGPIVMVVHGLEGSLHSHYVGPLLQALHQAGFQALFMHLRGCSDEPNRLDRSYHSGATEDLVAVLTHIEATRQQSVFASVGFSLGGNLLLKHLGEQETEAGLRAAVAVSVPFQLLDCNNRLEYGASQLYREYLMHHMRNAYRQRFANRPSPLQVEVSALRSFFDFDDQITAPLNGFEGALDYYRRCSCRSYLKGIQTNTLILHSLDDPFMWKSTIPTAEELGPGIELELSTHGGHVGFVGGNLPGLARYWVEQRVVSFLNQQRTEKT